VARWTRNKQAGVWICANAGAMPQGGSVDVGIEQVPDWLRISFGNRDWLGPAQAGQDFEAPAIEFQGARTGGIVYQMCGSNGRITVIVKRESAESSSSNRTKRRYCSDEMAARIRKEDAYFVVTTKVALRAS